MSEARAQVSHRVKAGTFWTLRHLTSPSFLLVVATVCLCAYGLTMVFSASSIELVYAGSASYHTAVSQAIYMAIGAAFFCFLRGTGTRWLLQFKWFAFLTALVIVMLVVVLLFGSDTHGAVRWLRIGPFSLQPSEFAKITIVMAAAHYFTRYVEGDLPLRHFFFRALPFVVLPLGLIFAEKDLGTLIIVGVALFCMAFLAGVKPRYLLLVAVVAVGLVGLAIAFQGYRLQRFAVWLDPSSDYYGNGWQSIHGFRALASGGFFGMGLGESRQKYSYLPEAENDYIFAVVGEELGFVGAMALVALFVFFGYCGLRIAYGARKRDDLSSSLLASSLTVLIEFQAFLNMAGVVGLLPLTGRPLPFITAGGSSVISCLIMAGLIAGVERDNASDVREGRERRRMSTKRRLSVVEGGRSYQEEGQARPALRVPGEVLRGGAPDAARVSGEQGRPRRPQGGSDSGRASSEREGDGR